MTSDADPPKTSGDQAHGDDSHDGSDNRAGHPAAPGAEQLAEGPDDHPVDDAARRPPDRFAATTLWLRGRPLVLISGPLDVRTAPVVESVISAAHRDTRDDLLVDVSGVSFCDCRGAAALGARRRVVVSGASPMLRQMCMMLGSRLTTGWTSVPSLGGRLGELPA